MKRTILNMKSQLTPILTHLVPLPFDFRTFVIAHNCKIRKYTVSWFWFSFFSSLSFFGLCLLYSLFSSFYCILVICFPSLFDCRSERLATNPTVIWRFIGGKVKRSRFRAFKWEWLDQLFHQQIFSAWSSVRNGLWITTSG